MKFPNDIMIIVPAKKKSQRLKSKNIKKLNNRHLIEYTFDNIRQIGAQKQAFLTSDSELALSLAVKYGISTVTRPKELSKASSKIEDALIHLLKKVDYKKFDYKWILLLQPTSPLRDKRSIQMALDYFEKYKKKVDTILSVTSFKEDLWSYKDGFLNRVFTKMPRMQQLRKNLFFENGMIYLFKINNLIKNKKIFTKKNIGFLTDKNKSIDINDDSDFELVKSLLKIKL